MMFVDLMHNLDNQFLVAYFYGFWFQLCFAYLIVAVCMHYVILVFKKLFFPPAR